MAFNANLGQASVEIRAKTQKFQSDMRGVTSTVNRSMRKVGATVRRTSKMITTALVTAFAAGTAAAVKFAASLEQTTIQFEVLLKSADKANAAIKDLRKFAAETPFQTDEVLKAGRALLAFGVEQEKLILRLQQIGDVAAGSGKDLNELVRIYGKVQAQGKLTGETLQQFADAGINLRKVFAEQLNVSIEEFEQMIRKSEISATKFNEIFGTLTESGGLYNDMMLRMSQTTAGKWSTAVSNAKDTLAELGLVILKQLDESGALDSLNQFFLDSQEAIRNTDFQPYIDSLKELATVLKFMMGLVKQVADGLIAIKNAAAGFMRGGGSSFNQAFGEFQALTAGKGHIPKGGAPKTLGSVTRSSTGVTSIGGILGGIGATPGINPVEQAVEDAQPTMEESTIEAFDAAAGHRKVEQSLRGSFQNAFNAVDFTNPSENFADSLKRALLQGLNVVIQNIIGQLFGIEGQNGQKQTAGLGDILFGEQGIFGKGGAGQNINLNFSGGGGGGGGIGGILGGLVSKIGGGLFGGLFGGSSGFDFVSPNIGAFDLGFGGISSTFTDSIGGPSGWLPGFANGGRPRGPSIVGEKGPELFIPDGSGEVIPNDALGSNVTQNFNMSPGLPETVRLEIMRFTPEFRRIAQEAVTDSRDRGEFRGFGGNAR